MLQKMSQVNIPYILRFKKWINFDYSTSNFFKKSPCMLYFVKIEAFLSLMIIDILQMFGEVPSLMGINTFFFLCSMYI